MNKLIVILSVIKTLIIVISLINLSLYIPFLSMLFTSKLIAFSVFQYIYVMILSNRLNPNKIRYIGCFFIMIDDIVLKIFRYYKKD